MNLTLGYSPCPNDTFIFYALAHGRIGEGNINFRESLLDIETLNKSALRGEFDITKISFHAYLYIKNNYVLLNAGGALGRGCGPMIVAREPLKSKDLKGKRIAIPGAMTTAYLLLKLYEPECTKNIVIMPFHEILDAVRSRIVDAGLIIHESRFTYSSYGLQKVIDLGQWWEEETGLPIPLGCIVIKRKYYDIIEEVEEMIRKSMSYAYGNREEVMNYIKKYARELDDSVIASHIDLYVNGYSYDFGDDGKKAIDELLHRTENLIGEI